MDLKILFILVVLSLPWLGHGQGLGPGRGGGGGRGGGRGQERGGGIIGPFGRVSK